MAKSGNDDRTAIPDAASLHEVLARFQEPLPHVARWQIVTTILPLVALLVAMHAGLAFGWWPLLALGVPAAALTVRTFIIQHDCGHGSFFRARRANDLLGRFCSLLTLTDETVRISRAASRNRSVEDPGTYSFELLTPQGSMMEAFLFHVGAEPTGGGQQHDGEEMFLVLSGTVEMRTPDRSYVLEAGDCAYFPGHIVHQMRRIGPEPATAVIAVARERISARRKLAAGDVSRSSAADRGSQRSLPRALSR